MGSNTRPLALLAGVLLLLRPTAVPAQIDSAFVETFVSLARVNGGIRYRDNTATFSVGDSEVLQLNNRGLALRIGGRYKWIGYTFSIPVSDLGTQDDLADARSLGANLQFYRDKFYLNANIRKTTGFQREREGEEKVFREDIDFFNLLIFGFRILNSSKFSLRSAFRMRNRQLKSSGSLLLGGAINRQILNMDSLILPFRQRGEVVIDRYSQTKFGVGLGYAHTFVLGQNVFITPLLVAGPELRFTDYDPLRGERETERVRVSPRIRGRLAVGWNAVKTYIALTGAYLPSIDTTENIDTRVDETRVELVIGRRFGVTD